jgi:hypothetical protein
MKRDWDVIRAVLTEIEDGNGGKSTYGERTEPIRTGHAFLLRDAGFISERVNGCETHLFTSLTSKWV